MCIYRTPYHIVVVVRVLVVPLDFAYVWGSRLQPLIRVLLFLSQFRERSIFHNISYVMRRPSSTAFSSPAKLYLHTTHRLPLHLRCTFSTYNVTIIIPDSHPTISFSLSLDLSNYRYAHSATWYGVFHHTTLYLPCTCTTQVLFNKFEYLQPHLRTPLWYMPMARHHFPHSLTATRCTSPIHLWQITFFVGTCS